MTSTTVSTSPNTLSLAHISSKPLTWLWPDRIPLGHLTLLDAAPGSGLSLFALTLAACISRGTPFPDGTPSQQGNVLLIAPYDAPDDTIKPRFEAAGGDPTRLVLYRPLAQETPQTTVRSRALELPRDLDQLATTIHQQDARLVIIDPASAIFGLHRCLPALIELAHHANCAILLTRSLRQPPADPLHTTAPTSPMLEAARSRLLLTPDPTDERRHLFLTSKHPLCALSSILSYEILVTGAGIPTIHWLDERDRAHLARLGTGPIHSLHRQAILHFLHNSSTPRHIKDILRATSYDYEAGRKMLVRMKMSGELVSPAIGLYSTANHPCLATFTPDTQPAPPSSAVSNVPGVPSPTISPASKAPSPQTPTTTKPSQHNVPTVPDTGSPSHFIPWSAAQLHQKIMDTTALLVQMSKTNTPSDGDNMEDQPEPRNMMMSQTSQPELSAQNTNQNFLSQMSPVPQLPQ